MLTAAQPESQEKANNFKHHKTFYQLYILGSSAIKTHDATNALLPYMLQYLSHEITPKIIQVFNMIKLIFYLYHV